MLTLDPAVVALPGVQKVKNSLSLRSVTIYVERFPVNLKLFISNACACIYSSRAVIQKYM